MKLVRETSPYIRKPVSVKRMMIDVLIALIPVVIYSFIKFKWYAVVCLAISLIAMIGTELLYHLAVQRKDFKKNFSINWILTPAISGTIYAMIIPSNLHLFAVAAGAILSIFLGKLVFGGLGQNIFNPAGVGRILTSVMWPMAWTAISTDVNGGATALSSLGTIKEGLFGVSQALDGLSVWDLFIGNTYGATGEGCVLAILIGGIYLFIRRSADIRVSLSMIISFALFILTAGVCANLNSDVSFNVGKFLLCHLFSGGLMFGAIYMVTDPVTSPVTQRGRIIFGASIGALVAFIRIFGSYPEGVAFAILIMNAFVPAIDYYKWSGTKYTKKFVIIGVSVFVILLVIMGLLTGIGLHNVGGAL